MRKYDNKKVCASLWNYAANVAEQARQENDQVAIYRAFKHIVQSMLRDYVAENVCDFEELADHALFVMDRERRSLRSADPQLYDAMLNATSEFFELHQDFYFEVDMEDLL
jgi:hypothetical protein